MSKINKKTKFLILIGILIVVSPFVYNVYTFSYIPKLFKLNKKCQEEGYYMALFEFKMLGLSYYLDKGEYLEASKRIRELYNQMRTRKGLIKVPNFTSKEEEYNFYRNLQNPETGSFMDSEYPLCTHHEPTKNVVAHLERLSLEIGVPLSLKYPLRYLEQVDTPEEMINYLNDISTISWPAYKLTQTTFHHARDILSLANENDVITRNKLFTPTSELKQILLQWFYDAQDPETGLWGPKSKKGKLLKMDLSNTSSILKAFINAKGEYIHPQFPVHYQDKIFASVFKVVSEGTPQSDDLDLWHEWRLRTSKGLRVLPRYLWKKASIENKEKTVDFYKQYVVNIFKLYYVKKDGAFSYYPKSQKATLDGTGVYSVLVEMGGLSNENYQKLWGDFDQSIKNRKSIERKHFTQEQLDGLNNHSEVNSIRFYTTEPNLDTYCSGAEFVYYPKDTDILDAVELISNIKSWLSITDQSMGNWVAKSQIENSLKVFNWSSTNSFKELPENYINTALKENGEVYFIAYNTLSLPVYKLKITSNEKKK